MAGGSSHGKQGLTLEAGGELVTDRYGLVTGRLPFKVPAGRWDLMPQLNSVHPHANFAWMDRRRVIFTPGLWTVQGDYAGCEKDETEKVYELQRDTQREPIETHPDFVERIGGKPSAPQNGAVFIDDTGWPTSDDKIGVFSEFRMLVDGGARNPLAGTDSYLAPTNTMWTAQWTSRSLPAQVSGVGKIAASVPGGAPDFGDEFSWLNTGITSTKRARIYSNRQVWLLGAWIPEVYSSS